MKNQSLPKGFRYFFTKKEAKEIATDSNILFEEILSGNIANPEKFNLKDGIQSNIHPISISGRLIEATYKFRFYQFGFRNELLPDELEKEAKRKMVDLIKAYLAKISSSKQTNLLNHPQLWTYCKIINKQVFITGKELT